MSRVVPTGGARGQTLEVNLQGDNLEDARELYFSDPSVRATHKDGLTFRIEIGGETPLGAHQCWAAGRFGVSFPVTFMVDDLNEASEKEPNDTPEAAQPVAIETTVNGAMQAGADRDVFKLSLKTGQRVFADCLAERIDSELDATLEIFSLDGKRLAQSRDYFGEDPFLDFKAPDAGDYLLVVRDFTYQGGGDRHYRLRLTARPFVEFVMPAAVPPGQSAEVQVYGRNLPGGKPLGSHWLGGTLEIASALVKAPAEPEQLLARYGGDRRPGAAKVDLFQFRLPPSFGQPGAPGQLGSANAALVGFAGGAVRVESEPNEEPEAAQKIPVPCDLSGQLSEGDRDWVEFEAKKGERLWIEVIAARMGSAVDAHLTLTKADAASSLVREVDDDSEVVADKRFETAGIDPATRFDVPDDGRYRIMMRDLASGRRGLGLFYRLVVKRVEPDVRVFLLASRPQAADALTLRRGGSDYYETRLLRRGGYEGTVRVEATGLPLGVTCQPAVLGPSSAFAPLVFTAEAGAAVETASIRVVATGWAYGERRIEPALGYVMDRYAGDDKASANLVRHVREIPLGVVEDSAPFALTASPDRLALKPGEKAQVKVGVRRTAPFDGEVALSSLASVPGLKIPGAKIEKGKPEAAFEIQLDAGAAPGRYTFAILGEAEVPFTRNPKDKPQNIKTRYPTNALTLDVVGPLFDLRIADLHGGKLTPGATLALDVAVQRKHGFEGAVVLSLVPPEAVKDLQAADVRLPRGATAGTLSVKALEGGANPGPRPDLIVRASADLFGTPVIVEVKVALEVGPKK